MWRHAGRNAAVKSSVTYGDMSRIGKKPITLPQGVTVNIESGDVEVKGPKGGLRHTVKKPITVKVENGSVLVERPDDSGSSRAFHGLTRALVANMVEGVSKGFEKKLLINGVGYRASIKGKKLVLLLGYSHPVELESQEGITFEVNKKQNEVTVKGIDKGVVGQVAANIREARKTEPYKGKGIRYEDEIIRRKAGKSVAGGK